MTSEENCFLCQVAKCMDDFDLLTGRAPGEPLEKAVENCAKVINGMSEAAERLKKLSPYGTLCGWDTGRMRYLSTIVDRSLEMLGNPEWLFAWDQIRPLRPTFYFHTYISIYHLFVDYLTTCFGFDQRGLPFLVEVPSRCGISKKTLMAILDRYRTVLEIGARPRSAFDSLLLQTLEDWTRLDDVGGIRKTGASEMLIANWDETLAQGS